MPPLLPTLSSKKAELSLDSPAITTFINSPSLPAQSPQKKSRKFLGALKSLRNRNHSSTSTTEIDSPLPPKAPNRRKSAWDLFGTVRSHITTLDENEQPDDPQMNPSSVAPSKKSESSNVEML